MNQGEEKVLCGHGIVDKIIVQSTNTDGWTGNIYKSFNGGPYTMLRPTTSGMIYVDGDGGDQANTFNCHTAQRCTINVNGMEKLKSTDYNI